MILPTLADVVELAENGTLLEAIFSDRWHCRYQHFDAIAQLLADAHNGENFDLLDTLSASGLAAFSGFKGYQGRRIYSLAMERLNTSVTALLPSLRILASQADGEAHETTETLRKWCSASPNRPRELIDLVDSGKLDACDFYSLQIAIRNGLKADLPYFTRRAYALIENGTAVVKAQVIQALSSPPFNDDAEWRRALDVLGISAVTESDDEVRSALVRTLLSFTESIPQRFAMELEELTGKALHPITSKVAHHLAYALAFSFKDIQPSLRALLLAQLGAIQLEVQTQKLIDLGLANLIKAGGADEARDFITRLLMQPGSNLRFELFDSTIRNLIDGPVQDFETWIVDWLRTAPHSLCKEMNECFFRGNEEYTFRLELTLFNFTESEYAFIARRATSVFFMTPVIAASFLVNLGRCAQRASIKSTFAQADQPSTKRTHEPPSESQGSEDWDAEISDLLFDPLLINYTSAQKHLQPIADDTNDKSAPMVKRALKSLEQYCDEIEKVGFIVELGPSEREKQLEGQRRSDVMNDAMQASRKDSPFAGIFAESILLYGNGMVTWIEDSLSSNEGDEQSDRQPTRLEHPLASISHSVELPREMILEPVGLQMKLMSLRNAGKTE
ncbi:MULTISPECIES: hypothetical protein [Pseudomonas]|uniref:hypothetical protein n=1 Tax=Pseudomonadaceae TaxID=135621 RepID=UPI0003F5C5E1|nr:MULTISPECIES: hypothetical protein [Pseudomonas]